MHGYFHFRWASGKVEGLPLPQGPGSPAAEAQRLFEADCAGGYRLLDSHSAEAAFLSTGPRPDLGRGRVHFALIREADDFHTLGCKGAAPRGFGPCNCRAFLLHPKVIAKLRSRVAGGPLPDAFSADAVADDPEVARMLASAAEMEGEVREGQVVFHRLPVPECYDVFPPLEGTLQVVIVIDAPAAE
jgi:hypothetical protein